MFITMRNVSDLHAIAIKRILANMTVYIIPN
jgi:hypothetical protein